LAGAVGDDVGEGGGVDESGGLDDGEEADKDGAEDDFEGIHFDLLVDDFWGSFVFLEGVMSTCGNICVGLFMRISEIKRGIRR